VGNIVTGNDMQTQVSVLVAVVIGFVWRGVVATGTQEALQDWHAHASPPLFQHTRLVGISAVY
jgi:hypothetical protein